MFLATNEQKGRTHKLSSWDAFFLLLAVLSGFGFPGGVASVPHTHTGRTLF